LIGLVIGVGAGIGILSVTNSSTAGIIIGIALERSCSLSS